MSLLNPRKYVADPLNKSFDIGNIADFLNQLSGISGGVSQIISPEVQAEKDNAAQLQAAKDKKYFKIFIGVSVIVVVCLVGWIIKSKFN